MHQLTFIFYEKDQKPALKNELIEAVKKVLQPEDMVVLKGSNGMGLREVIDALLEK
jgi:UDP-N-acetylmuramyl pentapeptide synthase